MRKYWKLTDFMENKESFSMLDTGELWNNTLKSWIKCLKNQIYNQKNYQTIKVSFMFKGWDDVFIYSSLLYHIPSTAFTPLHPTSPFPQVHSSSPQKVQASQGYQPSMAY